MAEQSSPDVFLRRRLAAAGVVVLVAGVAAFAISAGSGGGEPSAGGAAHAGKQPPAPRPLELPGGGRRVLPDRRIVAYDGAPQSSELGALGIGSPDQAARRLARQARAYRRGGRPVLPAMELIAVVANAAPGRDGA